MTHIHLNDDDERLLDEPCDCCDARAGEPCRNTLNGMYYCPSRLCDQEYDSTSGAMNCVTCVSVSTRQRLTEMNPAALNPYSVMCVVTHDGKEVGRVAAAAHNAEAYLTDMARQYGSISVDYVEDSTAAMIDQMIRNPYR